jgi:Methyltransferase domain
MGRPEIGAGRSCECVSSSPAFNFIISSLNSPYLRQIGYDVAIDPRDLISDSYRDMNRQLHDLKPDYGGYGGHENEAQDKSIIALARSNKMKSILDYGCGKGRFKDVASKLAPELMVSEYDPAIPGKDTLPEPADLVICADVLEHIEPDRLDAVLQHIRSVTIKGAILLPNLLPAKKVLADGRNAHLILESPAWWHGKVSKYFNVLSNKPHFKEPNVCAVVELICTPKSIQC